MNRRDRLSLKRVHSRSMTQCMYAASQDRSFNAFKNFFNELASNVDGHCAVTSAGMRVREKYEWLKGIERTKIDKKGWTLEIKNSPRQPDHISCGMFTCQVMRSEKGWRSNHISGAGDGRQIVPVLASINHFKSSSTHTTMIDDDLLFE